MSRIESIKYRTYSDDILPKQHAFILEVTKDWKEWNYPSLEAIKEIYSRETFTPDTRHYAFDGEQMVGFISSAVEQEVDGKQMGSIQIPFIKDNDKEIEKFLMEKAINTLKEKGVQKIQTTVRDGWKSPDFKSYNYRDGVITFKVTELDYSKYDYSDFKKPEYVKDVDPVEDKEALIEAFKTEMTQTPEQIGQIIDRWPEATNILANAIVKEDDKILSHSMIVTNPDRTRATMTHISIYEKGKENLRDDVFKYLINKAKETQVPKLMFNVAQDAFNEMETYDKLGLKFDNYYRFDLDLEA